MFRALLFLLKAGVLVAAIMWFAERPGMVSIEWQGYLVETSVGVLIAFLLTLFLLWAIAYRIWRAVVSVPAYYRRYRVMQLRETGYRALTRGLVAIAAGDGETADKYATKAENLIPGTPLTKLLTAQTALLNGNAPKARREFTALLEDDVAAFFGVRGLLNETLQTGNSKEALDLARRAEKLQPRRLWVIRNLFDLEVQEREWEKADVTLHKAEKIKVFTRPETVSHRQALLTARSDEAFAKGAITEAIKYADKALGLRAGFIPAAVRLVKLYEQVGKRRAAMRVVERTWSTHSHPELADLWMTFMPKGRRAKTVYEEGRSIYDWAKRLYDLAPKYHDSHRLLGLAALDAKMWKEAREHLLAASDYKSLAKLERVETGNEAKAREWLETAAESPPDPKWLCSACGHAALDWTALCHHCHDFNTYAWAIPSLDIHEPPKKIAVGFDNGLIAPPA